MNAIRWWNGLGRQKRVGWTLIVAALMYMAYFLKVRLLAAGPSIEKKEWFYVILMLGLIMLGTVNVRMAEMRER